LTDSQFLSRSELHERFFAAAEDLLAIADTTGRVVEVNPAWQDQLGWNPGDLVGHPYLDFVHPDDRSSFGSEALRLIESGARVSGASRCRASDGSWHMLWWTARSRDGLVFAIARDVTSDAQAHRAMQDAERRLSEIAGHLDEVLFIGTTDGATVEWSSPAFERVWGRPVADLLADGAAWQRDLHPDDVEGMLAAIRDGEGGERDVRYRMIRPDNGEIRYMRTRLRPIADTPGRSERVVGITQDVTEQVLHEQRVARQSAGHAAVARLGQAALDGADVDDLIEQAARAAHELLDADLAGVLEHRGEEHFVLRAKHPSDVDVASEFRDYSQAAHTLRTGLPVIVEDIAEERRFTYNAPLVDLGLRSGVTVPIGDPEAPWGILGALSTRPREYSAEELHVLQGIGHVLGHALSRRSSRAALAEAESRMRRAHRLARLGSFTLDLETSRLDVTPEAHELIGSDAATFEGSFEELLPRIHPDDIPTLVARWRERHDGPPLEQIEFRTVEGRWLEVRTEQTEDGRRHVGTFQDITERKQHEEQLEAHAERLRTSEQRFRSLAETAAEGIWVVDLEGRAQFVNARAAELSGRPIVEVLGMRIQELVHPDDRALIEAIGARRGVERGSYDVRIVRPGGAVRWLNVSASPLRDEAGAIDGMLAMANDITERRQAEESAQLARRHFEGAFRDAPIGMAVLGRDGHFVSANSALCQMSGYDADELAGARMDLLTPPEFVAEGRELFARVMAGEAAPSRLERPILRKDGERCWCLILATATRDEQGTVQSIVVQFEDITERRREQERLRSQVEELAWLERIRYALDNDEFVLEAQPIVSASSGELLREELLIRMRMGERIVPPLSFLPVAERHGLIQSIDAWVADRAAALAASGRPVQMNVSAVSAGDARFLDALEAALARHAPPAGSLIVELTETALADDMAQAKEFAAALQRLGVPLALDDFGVGWASLQYLKTLPGLRCLKIDASFVSDLVAEERSQALVRAIVELARSFGQETIAEGVEDEPTRALLCELGVDGLQGYLLGRPGPL
jgi:PAS domain S-box-containing protein